MSLVIGLMSGTSMDGVDVALVRILGPSSKPTVKLLSWKIFPFPKKIKKEILSVAHTGGGTTAQVCRLNFELGKLFAHSILSLCRRAHVSPKKILVVGSHGQTICHLGKQGTLQIGEPSVIAERTGITTVADFRPRDVAAGGEGAPLAPYVHALLFQHPQKNRVVHNLGGISNLTYLPHGKVFQRVVGFDTGPGNMVMDGLLREFSNHQQHYDHGGKIAAKGIVSLKLLKELLAHPFLQRKPPKTAGREEFGKPYVQQLIRRGHALVLRNEDLVATATAFTACSLAENYRKFVFPKGSLDEIIFGGGGVHNATLMKMIAAELPGIQISTFDDYGIASDAFEAVCFGVLGYQTLRGRTTNLPSVTGARKSVILGKIIPSE